MELVEEQIDEKGEAPEMRVKDACSARSIYGTFNDADKPAAHKRAANQRMFDGEAPWRDADLARAGQKNRTNINMGEAEDLLGEAMGPYIDMLSSMETLFSCPTTVGANPEERKRFSQAIAKEISSMIRRWPKFPNQYRLNARQFISQGISLALFKDHYDWRFEIKGLSEFRAARDVDACVDSFDICFFKLPYTVSDLWGAIRNEGAAAKVGWKVDVVKNLLIHHSKAGGRDENVFDNWEALATRLRTDDIGLSNESKPLDLVMMFVPEYDGTVSQFIFALSGETKEKDFLFEKRGVYGDMSQAVSLFAYGTGNTGKLYEIRGLGSKIYPAIQVSNRMHCQTIDSTMLSASQILRPKSISDLGRAQLANFGPYTVLHPGTELISSNQPNFAMNAQPLLRSMSDMLRIKVGSYTATRALTGGGPEKSQFEASALVANASGMTVTSMAMFLEQFETLIREMVRRISRKSYTKNMPGGDAVDKMRKRLSAQGIPMEALYGLDIEELKVTRPVGVGSKAARDAAFRRLRELAPGMDPEGQRNLYRDEAASEVGYDAVDSYFPPAESQRAPAEWKIAILENSAMRRGEAMPVSGEEFHVTHLEAHVPEMQSVIEAVDQGQMELGPAVQALMNFHQHCTEHLNFISGDPVQQANFARFSEVLQQSGEIITNGLRALQKQAREQAAQAGQQDGQEPNRELEEAAMKHELKLRQMLEEFQVKMQIAAADAEAKRSIAIQDAALKRELAAIMGAGKPNPFAFDRAGRIG